MRLIAYMEYRKFVRERYPKTFFCIPSYNLWVHLCSEEQMVPGYWSD